MNNLDPIISGIRNQAHQLKELISQIESDLQWQENTAFYADRLQEVEWNLRKLRGGKIRCYDLRLAGTFSLL